MSQELATDGSGEAVSNFSEMLKRYRNDADFHQVVTLLENMIENLRLTPSEIRDAAMFAAIRFEQRSVQPIIFDDKEEWWKP